MNIIKQLGIILLFVVVGEFGSFFLRLLIPTLFFPGALLGMLFMILAFYFKWIKIDDVSDVGGFLTKNMPFFFIPAAVSVMEYFDLLAPIIGKILLIVIASGLLTFLATAYTVEWMMKIQHNKEKKEQIE